MGDRQDSVNNFFKFLFMWLFMDRECFYVFEGDRMERGLYQSGYCEGLQDKGVEFFVRFVGVFG